MNRPIKKDANYMQNLIDYTKRNLNKGYAPDSLRWALINQGHSRIEVDKALAAAQGSIAKAVPASRMQPSQPQAPSNSVAIHIEPESKQPFWKRWFS